MTLKKSPAGQEEKERQRAEKLADLAVRNPFRLFTAEELAYILGTSNNFVYAAKNKGAPFRGGKTRPEKFIEWLFAQDDFVVKQHLHKPRNGKTKK